MTPTLTLLTSLEDEVAYLLGTKAEFFTPLRRSSAALSALETLYEELESAWQELNTPTEQRVFDFDSQSFEQRKHTLRSSLLRMKRDLRASRQALQAKQHELTLSDEQLIDELMRNFDAEWRQSARSVEQRKELLTSCTTHYAASMKAQKESSATVFTQQQQASEQRKQQRTRNLTERRQSFEQKKTSYEAAATSSTSLADWQQRLTERKQSLQSRRDSLSKLHNANNTLSTARYAQQSKQRTDLPLLTKLKNRLESEHTSFLERRTKLVQAGWLSEDELPPVDFTELASLLK